MNLPDTILRERARKLAAPVVLSDTAGIEPMLGITLSHERFLVSLRSVREVAALESLTPIPGLPFQFAGLTTLRGNIIPILDVRGFLGLQEQRPEGADNILIVDMDGSEAGVWVDEVHGLFGVDAGLLTTDHALDSAAFRGRTSDLSTVVDLTVLLASARSRTSAKPSHQEA